MYAITIQRHAQKELASLEHDSYVHVRDAIRELAKKPRPSGAKKLTGHLGWRIRIGSHRVLYEIDDQDRVIPVIHIGHRRDVYR